LRGRERRSGHRCSVESSPFFIETERFGVKPLAESQPRITRSVTTRGSTAENYVGLPILDPVTGNELP
jgi:hypothetical protein